MSCLIDLCLSVNMLFYAFLKKFYSFTFTVAYTIHFSFEYSVQRFFVFCFFFLNYRHPVAQLVKNSSAMQETWFNSWFRKIHWKRGRLPTPVFLSFPGDSAGKESACSAGDLVLIPGLGRSFGGGNS